MVCRPIDEPEPECCVACAAPPFGCHVEGYRGCGCCGSHCTTPGPTCGEVVCPNGPPEVECCVACAPPPEGCHYVGGLGCGPCSQVTCGELACVGPPLAFDCS